MPTTISLRLPTELLERLRVEARKRGTTVTDLLLGPWRDADPAPVPAKPAAPPLRGATVVAAPKRKRVEVVSPSRERLTLADVRGPYRPNLKKR